MNDRQLKLSLVQHLQTIIALIGVIVGPLVILLIGWNSIPYWVRILIIILVAIVILIYIIVPAQRWIRKRIGAIRKRRKQRLFLRELSLLLKEARLLFEPHRTGSLENYLNSIQGALVRDQALYRDIMGLSVRLKILGDWYWSLMGFSDKGFSRRTPFERIFRDVIRLYRDTAEIVRELANIESPAEYNLLAYNDQGRMAKERYNQHVGRLEKLLEQIAETNPDFQTGPFYRF